MSELYDYLLTAYKVIVGLVADNRQRLIIAALIAFGFYLVWICVSLYFSFQRKFSRRCVKLYNYIRKNQLDSHSMDMLDSKIEHITSGFYHGWKKFKKSSGMNPSDFINRRDALDIEVSGGVLNQGKSFMRTFIYITSALLFMFNLAYLGNDTMITTYLVAEALVLPLVYFAIMKLFYFLYTSIKQQLYKQDIECFYDLIALLDDIFGGQTVAVPRATYVQKEDVIIPAESDEQNSLEPEQEQPEVAESEEPAENEEQVEEAVEEDPANTLDKYDVFKKKNIDVDKIINEVPHNAGTSLPYINVDSDYVIKDDEHKETVKIVGEDATSTSILGMMQDRASLKKNNANFLDVDKDVAKIDEEKLAEINAESEEKEEEKEVDPFGSLGQFEVAENAVQIGEEVADEKPEETAEPVEEKPEPEDTKEEPEVKEEPVIVPVGPEPNDDEVSDEERESIAVAVSGFKAKKSKLASGGVVIERNQPIVRRERPVQYEEPVEVVPVQPEPEPQEYLGVSEEIQHIDINENTDSILNSIKSSAGGAYDPSYQGYPDPYANQVYGQNYGYQQNPYGQNYAGGYMEPQPNPYGGYAGNPYAQPQPQQTYQGVNQNPYNQNFDAYDEPEEDYVEEDVEETPVKKTTKKVRTKEEEPRPRNLRKKSEAKVAEEVKTPAKTRGRPKKQEVSESMVIKNDKEFDEVLSRAEKLMRKSEEGLSASQSKRIEKELKILMDAMNRYKESK